jgi:hypothetical protein
MLHNTIKIIKSGTMALQGYADEYKARVGRPDGTDQFEDMGIN